MKFAILALLGLISTTEAAQNKRHLIRLNTYDPQYLQAQDDDDESESESESDDENTDLMLDATSQLGKPCVYLDETQAELDYQMDMFSRTLDPRHWTNAENIAGAMKKK